MISQLLRRLLGDRRGVAAVEFAMIAPILAFAGVAVIDGWNMAARVAEMRTSVKAGGQYYMSGGTDDAAARAVALAAWVNKPADGTLAVERSCKCGGTVHACNTLCSDSKPPASFISLTATRPVDGTVWNAPVAAKQVVRVR